MSQPKLSREDFDVLVKLSGLPLDESTMEELYVAYGYVEQMKARVRAGVASPRELEPAHLFRPLDRSRDR